MMMARRRPSWQLAALLFLVCLAAPVSRAAGNSCADGGRPRPDDGGVGGTGILSLGPDDEGGIGGTGVSARMETGIIGTVTGFASICVGGVEIHYTGDTPVEVDGQSATAAQLAIGQVVEVAADGTGSEVRARHISVHHVVSGTVTRVDLQRNELDVIGQTVRLSAATRAGGVDEESPTEVAAFPLHSFVQVSGMRRSDGVVMASRVTRGEARDLAQLTGPVTRLAADALIVAGTEVRIGNNVHASIGDDVQVVGHWDGSAIVAQSVEALPSIPFGGRVDRLAIEGFARESVAGQLRVGSLLVEVPRVTSGAPPLPGVDAHIRVEAIVHGDRVIVERISEIADLPTLPAVPEGKPRGWNGDGSDESRRGSGGAPPMDQPRSDEPRALTLPPRGGHGGMPPGIPEIGADDAPPRPAPPDRPASPQKPDRPPQIPDRPPQMPDRPPQIPDRPPRPERPPRSDRMPPERPPSHPDMHGRR